MSTQENNINPTGHISHEGKQSWENLAISLDINSERYKAFLQNNEHLNIKAFKAVKGNDLSKSEIINQGIATKELLESGYTTKGLLGNAASHKSIWRKSDEEEKHFLVMEDDCYTHPQIGTFISNNFKALEDSDICLFGINTNSILQSISTEGLSSVSTFDPQHPDKHWIKSSFAKTSINEVQLHKLLKTFGTCAYFISPNGARTLLKSGILPLSLKTTSIPLITNQMPAISIDRSGCLVYPSINALVCRPFLAYTPNTDSSTA